MSLIVSFSQSQENIEYMEQKEIELTNDSIIGTIILFFT